MAAIRGSSLPIEVVISGVDLTLATITVVFARATNQSPQVTKSTTAGDITVTYDAGTEKSTLSLTLEDSETANWIGEVCYAIYVDDGTAGGDWIPDNGGIGSIMFTNSVKKT